MWPDDPVAAERQLLDPVVRGDAESLEALLHPDFVEFGSSGRVWDRASTIAALVADPGVDPSMNVTDMTSVAVDTNAALVTYVASTDERTTLRSSLLAANADRLAASVPSGNGGGGVRCRRRWFPSRSDSWTCQCELTTAESE